MIPVRLALQPVVEPLEIGIARPEIRLVDEVVIVRPDPQELVAGARLDIVEGRDDARLEDVVPGRGVKARVSRSCAGNCGRARNASGAGWRDDLVEKRLPGREIRIAREREAAASPRCRRTAAWRLACRIQARVARGSRGGGALQLGLADADACCMTASRCDARQARDVLRDPQPQPLHLDRVAFVDDVVVDARAAHLREERAQARMALRSGGERGRRARPTSRTCRPSGCTRAAPAIHSSVS